MLKTHAHSTKVNVTLFVTRAPTSTSDLPSESGDNSRSSSEGGESPPLSPTESDLEKRGTERDIEKELDRPIETKIDHSATYEKEGTAAAATTRTAAHHIFEHPVKSGRPDTASLIRDAVNTTPPNQRVLVAACGPQGLMRVVRDTTASLIKGDGPGVELHCEQFGW